MAELNVTASASFYADTSGAAHALLTVVVSSGEGAARPNLALADFHVSALTAGLIAAAVTVEAFGGGDIEKGKAIAGIPRGIYLLAVSLADGTGFNVAVPWTFIIHVDKRSFWVHSQGWAVAGVDYRSTPGVL
jgi:hypothetical protein